MDLRQRNYLVEDDFEEAITIMGIEDIGERLVDKIKKLVGRVEDIPSQKVKLKTFLRYHAKQVLSLANKIETKKTRWQKIRGY